MSFVDTFDFRIQDTDWRLLTTAGGAIVCVCDQLGLSIEGESIEEVLSDVADNIFDLITSTLEEHGFFESVENMDVALEDDLHEFEI